MSNEEKDLTPAELDALEALEQRATPVEWHWHGGRRGEITDSHGDRIVESDNRIYGPSDPDGELIAALRNAATLLIAMARRATSSGEWLNRMAEAVGYTGAAHPADVLQRIDDAVAAEARVRELEAERDAARKTIRDAVQWPEAAEPHLPSILHNPRAALAKRG